MTKIIRILLILSFTIPSLLYAQKKDTIYRVLDPIHKNVIKFNPTPRILWSDKNWTFSYERILTGKQSFAVSLGCLVFPRLFRDTIANLVKITDRHKQGINFTFEYRFYLSRRNTRPIPDGLYLAPFFSFYGYQFSNGLDVIETSAGDFARIKGDFYALNMGAELGYQFVFWKRLTVDLVLFGPATSYYGGKVKITGDFNLENIKELNEEFYNKLKEKYPMVGDFVVNKTFKKDGTLDLLSLGFRYLIQVGFHF